MFIKITHVMPAEVDGMYCFRLNCHCPLFTPEKVWTKSLGTATLADLDSIVVTGTRALARVPSSFRKTALAPPG